MERFGKVFKILFIIVSILTVLEYIVCYGNVYERFMFDAG